MESSFVGIFTIGQTLDRGIRLYKLAIKKVLLFYLVPGLLMTWPAMQFSNPANLLAGNWVPVLGLYLLAGIIGV
jgi:hypothetical protein